VVPPNDYREHGSDCPPSIIIVKLSQRSILDGAGHHLQICHSSHGLSHHARVSWRYGEGVGERTWKSPQQSMRSTAGSPLASASVVQLATEA
jgi:hypothetical protein